MRGAVWSSPSSVEVEVGLGSQVARQGLGGARLRPDSAETENFGRTRRGRRLRLATCSADRSAWPLLGSAIWGAGEGLVFATSVGGGTRLGCARGRAGARASPGRARYDESVWSQLAEQRARCEATRDPVCGHDGLAFGAQIPEAGHGHQPTPGSAVVADAPGPSAAQALPGFPSSAASAPSTPPPRPRRAKPAPRHTPPRPGSALRQCPSRRTPSPPAPRCAAPPPPRPCPSPPR